MSNIKSLSDLKKGSGSGGGGMGGGGGMPPGLPPGFDLSSIFGGMGTSKNIKQIHQNGQLQAELKNSGSKLSVVYFTASWCGPCKMIAPIFSSLADKYTEVVFIKIDVDECRETAQLHGIRAMPTFQFFKSESKLEEFSGADPNKLEQTILKYKTSSNSSFSGGYVLGKKESNEPLSPSYENKIASEEKISSTPKEISSQPTDSSGTDVNQVLLTNLIEMGFPKEKAIKALKATGDSSIQLAIDWCFTHLDDLEGNTLGGSAPPPKPDRSQNSDENMDTDIKPEQPKKELTPEEIQQQRLLIQERIKKAKEEREKQEVERDINLEKSRRTQGKEAQSALQKWKESQAEREAMLKKKEKEEERRAKAKIREKIAQDKAERAGKKQDVSHESIQTNQEAPNLPRKEYDEALIQIRLPDGNTFKATFKPNDPIRAVHSHIAFLTGNENFSLMTTFPKKIYSPRDSSIDTTLAEAELVPRGTLVISSQL